MNPAFQGLLVIAIAIGGCIGYFALSNLVLDKVLFAPRGANAQRNLARADSLRPWLFLLPALAMGALYLAYPLFETLRLSLTEQVAGGAYFWAGADNYQQMLGEDAFWQALKNSLLWALIVPALATLLGLVAAELTAHSRWGTAARALILAPTVISLVAAAVAWKLIYEVGPIDQQQIGLLNAVVTALGGTPRDWLAMPGWNNLALMAVLIWAQTGLAMLLVSPALGAVPRGYVETAILDGASPVQIFLRIKAPLVTRATFLAWTALTLVAVKSFDIVFALSGGRPQDQVLTTYIYERLFDTGDLGLGSAAAMVLMLLVLPLVLWNVTRARREMERERG